MNEIFCGSVKYILGTNFYRIDCGRMVAKEITVIGGHNSVGILTLCEVEVYSLHPPGLL